MLVATIISGAGATARLRRQAVAVGPYVDRINLLLPEGREAPAWAQESSHIAVQQAERCDARTLGLSPGDFCLFMDGDVEFPADYVARMLAAYGGIRLDRKIIGIRGQIYSDFCDGAPGARLVHDLGDALDRPELVNQLWLGSAACMGSDIEEFAALDFTAPARDLAFAIEAARRSVPLISIPRDAGWLKRGEKPSDREDAPSIRAAQDIAGFSRLPFHVLGENGRIPLRDEQTRPNGRVRRLDDDFGPHLLNPATANVGGSTGRPRMAVMCWSLGHNALGRAYTIAELAARDYDVEIVGTLVPRFGRDLWKPLRDAAIPIRGTAAADLKTLLSAARGTLLSGSYDIVVASKPRLPSVLLGMALALRNRAPLVLDIDDWEPGFLRHHAPLPWPDLVEEARHGSPQLQNPASELWTRYCDTLGEIADAVTVSSEALQQRYGGTVVAHARDERKFLRNEQTRRDMRRALGFSPEQKVVLFLGTARDHKGLARIADAVARRRDPKLVLCAIGSDADGTAALRAFDPRHVRLFGPQPFAMLADFVCCGDAVCLLQDMAHPAAAYQMPAKIGEALAMGIPLLVNSARPFSRLIADGVAIPVDTADELERALDRLTQGMLDMPAQQKARRETFLSSFSQAANIDRLRNAIELARAAYPESSQRRLARFHALNMLFRKHLGEDVVQAPRAARGWLRLRNKTS